MIRQLALFETYSDPTDKVYTKSYVAKDIIEWLHPFGVCLDPCKGNGAFYKYLPLNKEWCELDDGKDFFNYNQKVDWIVGNPPYGIFENFLQHSFNLANNVCFLVPTNKIFQRGKIMNMINDFGGIKGIRIFGSGSNIGFPFGFSVGAFWFAKDYKGKTEIILNPIMNSRRP